MVVAFEAHVGKLGVTAQAGLDVAHAHARAGQIGAQIQAELAHIGLGGAIHIATGVGVGAGHRAEVDDITAASRHHAGQHLAGEVGEADDVGLNHGLPVGKVGLMGRV